MVNDSRRLGGRYSEDIETDKDQGISGVSMIADRPNMFQHCGTGNGDTRSARTAVTKDST